MNQDDFRLISSDKEREQVLQDIASKAKSFAAMTHDFKQFGMALNEVSGKDLLLKLETPYPRALIADEKIDLMVGLPDGFFMLKTKVKALTGPLLMVSFEGELFKLQRRNNFRAPVPSSSRIRFRLQSFETVLQGGGVDLVPLDLSAGGARMTWLPAPQLPLPKTGDTLSGQIILPSGRSSEIFGVIKNVLHDGLTAQVGVEFQNLSVRDEQALLFTCMDLHRKLAPVK